jgi:hypothetical protein
MKWLVRAVTFALASSLAGAALAQSKGDAWDGDYRTAKDRRRAHLTAGLSVGLQVGTATGYPNESEKIDNPLFETSTGRALGPGGSAWLGIAMADWLSVGLGAASLQLGSQQVKAQSTAFLCRVETYPLYFAGGAWRDLGVGGQFGLGLLTLEEDGEEKADAGAASLLGGSLFYEAFRSAGLALGPVFEVSHMWSFSANQTAGMFGARLAFYSAGGREAGE